MTTQYHLVDKDFKNNIVDSAVLVEDGIVWDQAQLQMPLNYENAENVLIENNNESYLSANDDGNGTQYFSLLEPPNESVLNDLNDITLYTDGNNHVQISDQEGVNMICALDDQHHNVLAVTESDDLYAFQVAYDEDGHVQKYRYMLRLNENGEYETVPESLELLPEDIELPINEMLPVEEPQAEFESSKITYQNSDLIVKKEEHQEEHETVSNQNDDSYQDLQDNEDEEFYENEMFQENVESKIAVMNANGVAIHKIEGPGCSLAESNPTFDPSSFAEESENLAPMEPISNSPPNNHSLQTAELPLNSFSTVYALQDGTTHENEDTSNDVFEEEQLIINDENRQGPESPISHDDVNCSERADLPEDINGNESEEEFQIVDGVHVTADNDGDEDILPPVEAIVTKASEHHVLKMHENMSLLNDALDDIKIKSALKKNGNKGSKNFMYYVIKDPEKENVASLADVSKKVMKANPRSILKSSFTYFEEKTKPENQAVNTEKKPVKAKDNKGKVIQNFLAKTTIILAPVRQERMPRKQTIKPVKRADEEIIVQEVVVSSNGVIETKEDGVLKSKALLTPTDFVQVSDSDEDYDVKAERRKKKKKKKRRSKVPKIVISDTEDEDLDESIVEIDLSFDSDQEQVSRKDNVTSNKITDQEDSSAITDIKRRRGRPRKRQSSGLEESGSSSSPKKLKSTNESESSDVATSKKLEISNISTKWACSSCTKVFPSQGSLKTHMQYHTYHESAKKMNSFKKPLPTVFKQKDYQCIICYETFKNNYLLMKHTKEHNDPSKFECRSCHKLFCDQLQLTSHKRIHVKEQMFNSTTLPKDLPKSKKLQSSSISQLQGKYKCTFCSKIFTSQTLLNAHSSLHKRFICLSCNSTFMSKLAHEDHIRHNCVKQSSSPTLKNNKFHSPSKRVSIRTDTSNSNIMSNLRPSPSPDKEKKTPCSAKQINLKCDKCPVVFKSHKNLFTHKVLQHGMETPDKSIKVSKKKGLIHKELGKHSSVPTGEKLRNAFANLRTMK